MNQDDSKMVLQLVEICDVFVQQHAAQVKFAKAAQLRIENLEAAMKFCASLLAMPDVPQKRPLVEQFLSLAGRAAEHGDTTDLLRGLAHVESDHEKIEHVLAQLRASLQ